MVISAETRPHLAPPPQASAGGGAGGGPSKAAGGGYFWSKEPGSSLLNRQRGAPEGPSSSSFPYFQRLLFKSRSTVPKESVLDCVPLTFLLPDPLTALSPGNKQHWPRREEERGDTGFPSLR